MYSKSEIEIISGAFSAPISGEFILKNGKKVANLAFAAGNSKTGRTPAFNLLPLCTCSDDAKKTCGRSGCYATKPQRANVTARWARNTAIVKALKSADAEKAAAARAMLWNFFSGKLSGMRKKYMRLHVAGDFDSVEYGKLIIDVCRAYPEKVLYTYTKQFDILRAMHEYADATGAWPENLRIMLSAWQGLTIPADLAALHPVAYVVFDVAENAGKKSVVIDGRPVYVCQGTGAYSGDHETCATCGYKCAAGIPVAFLFH